MKLIDSFLNKITMYRLVYYYLIAIIAIAVLLSAFGILPFNPLLVIFSTFFILAVSWVANGVFAQVFKAPANVESIYITAFILALLITPPSILTDWNYFLCATWASILAMASKYIFA